MAVMTMLQSINATLADEMARDERVVVLGQDVGLNGGVFRATDGLLARFGPQRVVDTPLSESAIIGASLGLAVSGLVPVAEIQFLGFTQQAFHQLSGQLSRFRFRSQGRFSCPITIRAPFGGGVRSPELHSDSLEALYAHIPGLKVVLPSTARNAREMLVAAIHDPDPVLFLEPIRSYRAAKDEVSDIDSDSEPVPPLGMAEMTRAGTDLVVIAWSYLVRVAQRAAERVEAEDGASVGVLDLRCAAPLDVDALVDAVAACGRAVVVHEAPFTNGLGAEIVATLQVGAFFDLEAPIARVTGYDTPFPPGALEEDYVPTEERIVAAIRHTLSIR